MSGRCKAKIVQKPSSVVGELRAVSTGVTPEKAVASSRDGLRENNFDLLRLVFAGIVCLVHVQILTGASELLWIPTFMSADVPVRAFFVISGFLIFMSYERSSSLRSYFSKRVRRIYPAYFVIVVLAAVGLVAVSSLSPTDYFFSSAWIRYLLANLTFMNFVQPDLPGVFEANRFPAVDGSLWTLKVEVMFYASVPFLAMCFRRFGRLPLIAAIYVMSVAYGLLMTHLAERTGSGLYLELARQLPGQLSYFIAGAALFYYRDVFERRVTTFLLAAVAVLTINYFFSLQLLEPLALAVVVVFLGLHFYVGNFARYGDFSYGVYIVHFPIIQLLIFLGWFKGDPVTLLIVTVVLTILGAVLMWHLVEKRFLSRSSHYVAATSEARVRC
jgi:peptidoglycan/LPS O-acetylase OafA/YrhL